MLPLEKSIPEDISWKEFRNSGYIVNAAVEMVMDKKDHRWLRPNINNGYLRLRLPRLKKNFYLHTLIAECFITPVSKEFTVNHIDGYKINNERKNLEVISNRDNVRHQVKIGLMQRGEKNGHTHLTDKDVIALKKQLKSGVRNYVLSKIYGISQSSICDIKSKRTWRHL